MTVKQYTGRANINIYHGDCMEFMKDKPAKSYSLAICDPPYGIGMGQNKTLGLGYITNYKISDWDCSIPTKYYFDNLHFISLNSIIWGANYFTQYLPNSKGWLVYDKQQPLSFDFTFATAELAYTTFDKPIKTFSTSKHNMQNCVSNNKIIAKGYSKIHPTQKPVALYKWLLQNYAKQGDKILDTHGGSMSIAIACWDLGFDLDIIELDKDYYDKAVERFERHINQKQLF